MATVAAIMAGHGAWSLAERVRSLRAEAQRETRAYATALSIALEYAFADVDPGDVQAICMAYDPAAGRLVIERITRR